jgi:hypothetical protein
MSRSRKKYPGHCDRNPFMKTHHNRGVRRRNKIAVHKDHEKYNYIPSGNSYRNAYCSWDICDWKYILYTKSELRDYLELSFTNESYLYYMK